MALSVPPYLQAANIQDDSIRYEWDDWRNIPASEAPDEDVIALLEDVSKRTVFAFMCGTAEWIVHRFLRLCDNSVPLAFLEAAWATTIDNRYSGLGGALGWEQYLNDNKEWNGPVKRPIAKALLRLEIGIEKATSANADPVTYAASLAALANYVITDPTPYNAWSEEVLVGLEVFYPLDPDDPLGDVVPREAIDPELDFDFKQTEVLVNQFLGSLDHRSNMFLSSPDAMKANGFLGTPYVFNMAADRGARAKVEEGEDEGEHDHEHNE